MISRNLDFRGSVIAWRCFGKGPKAVICFHGYGEGAASFDFLEAHAGEQFTFYAIDLPFHGNTIWKEKDLSPADLLQIVEQICPQRDYLILGFSLGGRMGLSCFEKRPEAVSRLILLAPDGLKVNFWYWLATQTKAGRGLFRFTMKNPQWFFGVLKFLNRLRLVNASVFKFVKYYIGDRKMRDLLYARWITLRNIRPDLSRIRSSLVEYKTPTRIIYGVHDRIILSSAGKRFQKGIEKYCRVIEIPSGHQVLHEKHAAGIVAALVD